MKKLTITLAILAQLAFLNAQDSLEITYLGNEGFLIESSDKKVIIDALFEITDNYYQSATRYTRERLQNNMEPYNNFDLSLVTHSDGDHITASIVDRQMKNSANTYLIGPQEVTSMLNTQPNNAEYYSRIVGLAPAWNKYMDTTVNGIKCKAMRLHHDVRDNQNLGYLFEVNGFKIFHTGDYTGDYTGKHTGKLFYELDTFNIKNENIDVAFINFYSFWDGIERLKEIKDAIHPRHIALMHIETSLLQTVVDSVKNLVGYPPITIFQNPTDSKLFYRQVDTIIVESVNEAPTVITPIPDVAGKVGEEVDYTIPSGTFSDANLNDHFTYSVRLSDGNSLPDWLHFSPDSRTFSGIPTNTGAFTVEVTVIDSSFANVTDAFKISIYPNVSVNSNSEKGISIYPNPTSGLVYLSFDQTHEANVEMFNLQGKLLYSKIMLDTPVTTIDLTGHPKGIYLLKLTADSKIFTQKINLK